MNYMVQAFFLDSLVHLTLPPRFYKMRSHVYDFVDRNVRKALARCEEAGIRKTDEDDGRFSLIVEVTK